MKKKSIGIAIALAGIALSVGTSFALYTRAASDIEFGVGAYSHSETSGALTYTVTGVSNGTISFTNDIINTTHEYAQTLEFTLSGSYGNTLIAQDYIHGKLSVSFTLPSVAGVSAETSVYFTGYTNWGATAFGSDLLHNETPANCSRDITVETNGNVHVLVWLKFSGITAANYIQLAEQAATVAVTFGAPDTACSKFVVGDASNWSPWEQYRMVPNIKANSEQYMFKGLTGFNQAKCYNTANSAWSDGNNEDNMAGHTYNVYWNGSGSSAATFDQTA